MSENKELPLERICVTMGQKVRVFGVRARLSAHSRSEGECSVWLKVRTKNGYGRMTVNGQSKLAHRVAWEQFNGPIEDDLTIDHLCKNRACINVAHMRLVTRGENTLAGDTVSGANARKTHCDRGHDLAMHAYVYKGRRRLCRICRAINAQDFRDRKKEESNGA